MTSHHFISNLLTSTKDGLLASQSFGNHGEAVSVSGDAPCERGERAERREAMAARWTRRSKFAPSSGSSTTKAHRKVWKNDGVDGCWRFVDVCCRYNDKQSDAIFFRLKPVKKTILHIIHGAFLF